MSNHTAVLFHNDGKNRVARKLNDDYTIKRLNAAKNDPIKESTYQEVEYQLKQGVDFGSTHTLSHPDWELKALP